MQAIILAAGMGKRLGKLTKEHTKCMVQVNEKTLIERMLDQLEKRDLTRIVIVVGYKREKLKRYVQKLGIKTPIIFVENTEYDKTNNIYSLSLASEYLKEEDTILLESDLIFEDAVLDVLLNDSRETLALVDKYENWMDGTCVKLCDNKIATFVPKSKFLFEEKKNYYKTVNIYKFSRNFSETIYVPFLEAYQKVMGVNEYYEQVLRVITVLDKPGIEAKKLKGEKWYEIDDIQDLDIAESIFDVSTRDKAQRLQKRYGGYWRYPHMKDFCYLVNPYFPPQKLKDEIKANFEELMTGYPSGIEINSMLAGKNFGVDSNNIVVGNGAAELIKVIMDTMEGKVGVVRPTFEEYAHRYEENKIVVYSAGKKDFSYNVNDLMCFFEEHPVDNLILINPDNPSGNYLNKSSLLKLVRWAGERKMQLVVDESFVDFVEEERASLIESEIIENNKHLCIVKSISKSYGVPGLRLGILVSGDKEKISKVKQKVSIWNINSYAEFYLQIVEKYHGDYEEALRKFRMERTRMLCELEKINGIRVLPTQANYVMVEIVNGDTASQIVERMLEEEGILIKDLSPKISDYVGQYVRIAIRSEEDNEELLKALRRVMNSKGRRRHRTMGRLDEGI